jgi:hypothetical protein
MKRGYLLFLAILYCCVQLTACKLDPPIMPGDKDYVAGPDNTVPGSTGTSGNTGATGTTGTTGKTDDTPPAITGFWFCKSTNAEVYTQVGVLQSSAPANSFYYSITFDANKSVAAFKLTAAEHPAAEYYPYAVSKVSNKTFISFDSDPFFRSSNKQIEIVEQSALTMTWLIIDPSLHDAGGVKTYTASRLDLIKIP